MKKDKTVPAAVIRGTYSTWDNSKQRNLNKRLGKVVDLTLEDLLTVQVGGWGSLLKVITKEGVNVSTKQKNGKTYVYFSYE